MHETHLEPPHHAIVHPNHNGQSADAYASKPISSQQPKKIHITTPISITTLQRFSALSCSINYSPIVGIRTSGYPLTCIGKVEMYKATAAHEVHLCALLRACFNRERSKRWTKLRPSFATTCKLTIEKINMTFGAALMRMRQKLITIRK